MFQSPLSIVCISALIATAVNDRATLILAMNEFITFFTIYLRFRVQRKRRSQTWCIAFVATWSSFLTNVDLDENSCDTLNDRKALFIWHRWWCLRPQWNDMRRTQIFFVIRTRSGFQSLRADRPYLFIISNVLNDKVLEQKEEIFQHKIFWHFLWRPVSVLKIASAVMPSQNRLISLA